MHLDCVVIQQQDGRVQLVDRETRQPVAFDGVESSHIVVQYDPSKPGRCNVLIGLSSVEVI